MFDHASGGVVSKAAQRLACAIQHLSQVTVGVIAIAGQALRFAARRVEVDVAHTLWPLLAVAEPDTHLVEGIAQLAKTALVVVIQVDPVVVAITDLAQAQSVRPPRGRLEQPVLAFAAFGQQLAVVRPAYAQPFTDAEHRITQGDDAHIHPAGLLVDQHQVIVFANLYRNFVRQAPARAEQAIDPLVVAVVEALPGDRQGGLHGEVEVFIATQDLAAGRRMYRVGRTGHGLGEGTGHLAGHDAAHPAHQHATELAVELAATPAQQHQRGHRQADARRLAAAYLAHHDRLSTDAHVARYQATFDDHRFAGAAVTAAAGRVAIDQYLA